MAQNSTASANDSLYRLIAGKILESAREAKLGSDDMLPSVRTFAKKFSVGKGVVEQAFRYLSDEGICYAIHGKGTFLAQDPPVLSKKSTAVGLIQSYSRYQEEDNPFFRSLYEGAAEEAVGRDHNILSLYNWQKKNPFQKSDELAQFSPALTGFVALGIYDDDDCLKLRNTGKPVAAVDYNTETLGIDCAVIDNRSVMTDLCSRILEENPDQIFLADISRSKEYDPSIIERREAFEAVVRSKGKEVVSESFVYMGMADTPEKDLECVMQVFETGVKTAVICMDEHTAQKAAEELENRGFSAGQDFLLAYIGYPHPQYAILEHMPALIGAVDFRELGREGMKLLEERIEKGEGRAVCRYIKGTVIEWKGEITQ
jgi:DNA-binding LacI/PurR family transcriptional regulator